MRSYVNNLFIGSTNLISLVRIWLNVNVFKPKKALSDIFSISNRVSTIHSNSYSTFILKSSLLNNSPIHSFISYENKWSYYWFSAYVRMVAILTSLGDVILWFLISPYRVEGIRGSKCVLNWISLETFLLLFISLNNPDILCNIF